MPHLWVFAGPNGSGKSTVTSKISEVTPNAVWSENDIKLLIEGNYGNYFSE